MRWNSTAKSPASIPTRPRPCLHLDTSTWIWRRVWPIGALGLYPDSPWGHRFLGDMLSERDRWEDAALEYNKALAIDPRQAGLHTLLGEAYLHAGKLEDAETEFRHELQLDSRYERAWLGLVNLQLAKGQALEALGSVATVWQNSPEYLKAHPELPSIELTKEVAQACISRLLDQPEGPAKHLLLSALYASVNETDRSDGELQSFQNDLLKWQQTSACSFTSTCGFLQTPSVFSLHSIASSSEASDLFGLSPSREKLLYIAAIRTCGRNC